MEGDQTASESISVDCSMSLMADNTGPSQLQEITMDQDLTFSNTFGVRSPTGRTVKEVEQQLSNYKKENFDLKLRIYFLEEKMGVNYALDKDNVLKKNTELQVQVANLQRELKEKYDLLCQAVKALEMEEDEHRKYSATKEEQMAQLHQEMEGMRLQLQDLMSSESTKSGFSSSRHSENVQYVHDYPTNRRFMDDGIITENQHTQQLASFIYDTSETLRQQIEALQKDCENKDQAIDSLTRELSSANERLIDFAQQVKDYEEKLSCQHQKNSHLLSKMQEEQKCKDKLKTQLAAINQKFTMAKLDMEHERDEFLREKKALDRTNAVLDMRVSALDNETRQQKHLIKEMQLKMESTSSHATKRDTVAVSTSRAATAAGAAQADLPDAQVVIGGEAGGDQPLQRSQVPSTPDAKHLVTFETLLLSEKCQEPLRVEFAALKRDFHDQNKKIIKLKSEQLKACEIIKSMIKYRNQANEEIAQLKRTKEALERELENVVSRTQKETALRERVSELNITAVGAPPPSEKSNMADDEKVQRQDDGDAETLVEQYKQYAVELEAKIEVLMQTLKEKDSQMQYVTSQYDEIFELLKEKENRIVDLEFEMLSMNENSAKNLTSLEKFESEKRGSFYAKQLEQKDQEIAKLSGELRKCTCYLQEIVNKELWEKNREIEKMHVKQENAPELLRLRKELCCKDLQLKMLTKKIDELGLDIKLVNDDSLQLMTSPNRKMLQNQLKSNNDDKQVSASEQIVSDLEAENKQLGNKLRKTEHLLQECNGVCAILSGRLEELAVFLDSLLRQKSILGFLGSAKNKRLREIINNSLDMSRSFSMSLVNPEQSLTQLHNITALLNDSTWQELSINDEENNLSIPEQETHLSIVPDNISLTYRSHLHRKIDNEQVIEALREQVFTLKNELKVRDNELNRLQQERESGVEQLSESEQEDVKKLTPVTLKAQNSEAQSESEAWSEPDRVVSRARIGLCKSMPKSTKLDHCESTEDDDMFDSLTPSKRRSALMELNHDVYRLQRELDLKSEEIIANDAMYRQKLQEVECKLQESRENLLRAEVEKSAALKKVESLEKSIQELAECQKVFEQKMVQKDKDKQNAINELEKDKRIYVEQIGEAKQQLSIAEEKVKFLEDHSESIEKQLRKQYEADLIVKLKDAELSFVKQIKTVEEKCDAEIRIAQESVRLIQEEYARDYVKKVDVELKLNEAENLMKEFLELKSIVVGHEKLIESHKIKEQLLEKLVQENLDSVATLQRQLDNCNAHCCQLEQEKQILQQQEAELRVLLNDTQTNLTQVTQQYDEQVATLQKQKSNLELKISELEIGNADLHNRLIKAQTSRFSLGLNATLPALAAYRRNDDGVEAERAAANSSPDLGIESDHGRFSSLETNGQNIPRPLLPAVRLTDSMNEMFDSQMDSGIKNVCASEQCCQKASEVSKENNELKRKLLRMKRALEETATQLNLANQRKKQVEKTICNQIHKTSQVLRKAKANLDSGSESDVFRM